jgi:DNA-binding CsgD family transcriptional regulator
MSQEVQEIDRQLTGWTMTLGDPQLPAVVRADIIARYEPAKLRKQELEQALAARHVLQNHVEQMLDPLVVVAQLEKLTDVLAGFNPTLGNLELSKHIDKIVCHPDGKVEMRGTFLGVFEGAGDLLSRTESEAPTVHEPMVSRGHRPVVPRRRGRMRVPNLSADSAGTVGDMDTALDPERFEGLPVQFVWAETFVLSRKLFWPEQHAAEVARMRASGLTMEQLAEHFDKTVPTVRKALRLAARLDETVQGLPRKMPRRRWTEDHAVEVARLKVEGLSTQEIARRFGKSDTTIRAAFKHAEHLSEADQQKATTGDGNSGTA